MGLMTELLYPSKKKSTPKPTDTKPEQTEDKKPDASSEKMPDPSLWTLDDNAPNGGVPPNRITVPVADPPKKDPPRVEDPPNGGAPHIIMPPHLCQGPTPQSLPQTVKINVQHVHHHHGSYPSQRRQAPQAPAVSYFKFIEGGIRPCNRFPQPYNGHVPLKELSMPISTSIKDFHDKLDTAGQGCGFQLIHKRNDEKWEPDTIFAWGEGEGTLKIGDIGLGQGRRGQEIYLCKWWNNK